MAVMISSIDITLTIPARMRGIFPNEKELTIEFKAEKPKEVPDYVLRYYSTTRSHVFRDGSKAKKVEPPVIPKQKEEGFNPEEWLNMNYEIIDEAVKTLDRKSLLKVATYMRLAGNIHQQKSDRLQERIIQDVKIKTKQDDELEKHKGVEK